MIKILKSNEGIPRIIEIKVVRFNFPQVIRSFNKENNRASLIEHSNGTIKHT